MQDYTIIDKTVNDKGVEVRPDPKYKVGDWIMLTSGRQGRICYSPKWNDWSTHDGAEPQWYYCYDYYTNSLLGSEGSVLESDISCKIDLSKIKK